MRRNLLSAGLLCLLALAVPSHASPAPACTAWPQGYVDLSSGWRTQAGDNLAWAPPNFNDSSWTVISLSAPNDYAGWRWYRLRVQLPVQHPPLALLVTGGVGTYEVYLNGARLPGAELKSAIFVTYPRSRVIPLPPTAGDAEIALRTLIPPTSMFVADRGALRVSLGTRPVIETAHRANLSARFDEVAPGLGGYLVVLFASIPLLLLFWYQPHHREYLWLGCALIVDALSALAYEFAFAGLTPFSPNWFVGTPCIFLLILFQIEFTFSFIGQHVTRGWRIYQAFLIAYPACFLLPAWFGYLSRGLYDSGEIGMLVPAAVGLSILLLLWVRRGNREAGWLVLPSLLILLTIAIADVGIVGSYLHLRSVAAVGTPLTVGPFVFQTFEIADLLFLLAIGIVIFFRFTRVSREQARAAAELDAAQKVQSLLVPAAGDSARGWQIHSVYQPAGEVGGDFYNVKPLPDGAALIVVGDVSGKGVEAALRVAAVVGALRETTGDTPSVVLHRLNAILLTFSPGGFTTCLCARIAPDGTVTLANAGHLPPYRNGEEVPLDPGLPLGVASGTGYPESSLQLAPSDQFTFLSDGVVEAQSPTGELFGFDRTRAISGQTAEEIARAAQAHGQQDDITVLTLTFAPAEVLHA